jgi:UDP-N-acetylmuramate dehydrogenase
MTGDVRKAEEILRAASGERVRSRFPLAPLTTFRIGGPAALYLEVESDDDLVAAGQASVTAELPVLVLGKGSNVLVSDTGFSGIVLRLGKRFRWAARQGSELTAGGAMPLPALSGVALLHHLAGLEFGVAIPATLGGAVRMNAGAHGRSISDVLAALEVFSLPEGGRRWVPAEEARFDYRTSALGDESVVVGARVRLAPGEPVRIRELMDEARDWRRRTQPLAQPNCGSVFKNPPGDHAARLVEGAGAKGLRVGGAEVSAKHANFIVADRGARAEDVAELIHQVQARVADSFGVALETEVRFVGAFQDATTG